MSGVLEICFNGTGSPASPSATAAQELCNANLYDPYDKHFEELLYRCLANAPLEALEQIDLKQEKNWVLFADGYYFPKSGHQSMDRSSRGHDFLIGLTTGEWAFFENLFAKYMGKTDYSGARFRKTITTYMGISDKRLNTLENFYTQKYDPKLYSTRATTNETAITAEQWFWFEVVVNSMTDLVFHVPIVTEVEKLRSARVPPSLFVYTYNATLAAPSWNQNQHASHSDELPARDLIQTLGINKSQGPKREFDCGKTSVDPTSWNFGPRNLKIHQGVDSKDSSYPYFVRVEHVDETTNLKTNCGGSYIAPKWVLTAASCVRKNVRWYYYLSYRFRPGNKFEVQAQSQTARVWDHGDVALLELETDIDTSDDLGKRVCLEARGLTLKEPMLAFGMGDGEKAKVQEAILRAECLDEQDTFCGRFRWPACSKIRSALVPSGNHERLVQPWIHESDSDHPGTLRVAQ
ncbi:unnamed protein product, partial [Mesorhabditis belari]|uniref:Peptidase S1 domain-containing protein n=1 Tax=Mesorhabditis belari TaxID=2138241 RepID=A0AAF3F977_9BILA